MWDFRENRWEIKYIFGRETSSSSRVSDLNHLPVTFRSVGLSTHSNELGSRPENRLQRKECFSWAESMWKQDAIVFNSAWLNWWIMSMFHGCRFATLFARGKMCGDQLDDKARVTRRWMNHVDKRGRSVQMSFIVISWNINSARSH